jgi:hypothetical protein
MSPEGHGSHSVISWRATEADLRLTWAHPSSRKSTLREAWQFRNVEPSLEGRLSRIGKGRNLVFVERVSIKSQLVTHLGNSIGKIDTGATVSQNISVNVPTGSGFIERLEREGVAWPAVNCCLPNIEFEVLCELEAALCCLEDFLTWCDCREKSHRLNPGNPADTFFH